MYTYHFLINNQCLCKQWYDQAAQTQNMTFPQCKARVEVIFNLIFSLLRSSNMG